jgi:hypothetical protein
MNEKQFVQRGIDAATVLENPAYKEAMTALRAEIINSWKDCPVRDAEGQLLLLQLAKLSDKFEAILTGMIESGKLSVRKLEIDEVRSESKMSRFARKVVHG